MTCVKAMLEPINNFRSLHPWKYSQLVVTNPKLQHWLHHTISVLGPSQLEQIPKVPFLRLQHDQEQPAGNHYLDDVVSTCVYVEYYPRSFSVFPFCHDSLGVRQVLHKVGMWIWFFDFPLIVKLPSLACLDICWSFLTKQKIIQKVTEQKSQFQLSHPSPSSLTISAFFTRNVPVLIATFECLFYVMCLSRRCTWSRARRTMKLV